MGVVSGGKDGLVIVWGAELQKIRSYNLMDIPEIEKLPFSCVVHSVHTDESFSKVLVGCKGGEIYEIAKDSGRIILQNEAHSTKELWGLSMHPKNDDLYATTGDDALVRVWSISTRRVVRKMRLDSASRALAWSPDGKKICVGLGGDSTMMVKDGTFVILDSAKLEVLHEDRKSKMWITDIKYSPGEGKLLAMSSADGRIYIHDSSSYELKIVTQKITEPISIFDFDSEGDHLQCTTPDFRLMYFTVEDGKPVTSNAKLRDTVWDTTTCTLGWNVQGVWPKEDAGVGVDVTSVCKANKKKLLASVDNDGAVKVFHFPTQIKDMKYSEGLGNSNFMSKVRFNLKDEYLLAMGAKDRVIMQYKLRAPNTRPDVA